MIANDDIRKSARSAGIPLWKIADKLGVGENTLYRWLRKQVGDELRGQIMHAISELEQEVG